MSEHITMYILTAVLGGGIALGVKIVFDWLKSPGGKENGYKKVDHDAEIKHRTWVEFMLTRIFDNIVENQKLIRELLERIIDNDQRRGRP